MGAYFSYLSSFSVFAPIKINHFNYNLDDHKFGYQDVKAVEFLPLIFNQSKTISINISLLLFLSQTNLVYYILNFKKLVEYCFDGESFAEIDKKIDQKMIHISVILEKWLNYSIYESDLSQW